MEEAVFIASFERPHSNNPYVKSTVDWLSTYGEDLWQHLERVPELKPEVGRAILSRFLEQACQSQNMGNIQVGRFGLAALPREWVLRNLEAIAEPMLNPGDEWEWRRFLEVCLFLDRELALKLAQRAVASDDKDICESSRDFLE